MRTLGGLPEMKHLIEMKGICKEFPGVKALDNADFDLKPGEVHALLGENGAGKSTLVKVLSGIYTRDSGMFWVDGKPQGQLTPKKAQELGIKIIDEEEFLRIIGGCKKPSTPVQGELFSI